MSPYSIDDSPYSSTAASLTSPPPSLPRWPPSGIIRRDASGHEERRFFWGGWGVIFLKSGVGGWRDKSPSRWCRYEQDEVELNAASVPVCRSVSFGRGGGEAEGQRGGPIITASRQRQYAQDWIFKAC